MLTAIAIVAFVQAVLPNLHDGIQVVDDSGRGVAHAEIILFERDRQRERTRIRPGESVHDHLRAIGTSFTANENGVVRFPRQIRPAVLIARTGGHCARKELDPWDELPRRIHLEDPKFVRVRVVDDRGNPQSGIPVAPTTHDSHKWRPSSFVFESGSDGFATAGPLQILDESSPTHVVLDFPHNDPGFVPIPRDSSQTVVLTLPPVGSMAISLVDPSGRPLTYDGSARANAIGSLRDEPLLVHRDRGAVWSGSIAFEQGHATIPMIGPGVLLRFPAGVPTFETKHSTRRGLLRGPTKPSVHVQRTLTMGSRLKLIKGCAVDEHGMRWRQCHLSIGNSTVQTDFEGRFECRIAPSDSESERLDVRIGRHVDCWNGVATHATKALLDQDDVELTIPSLPLIVSGRVLDKNGQGIALAQVRVNDSWTVLSKTDAQGSFAIHGELETEWITLEVNHPRFLPRTLIASRGRLGSPIELDQGGGVSVTVFPEWTVDILEWTLSSTDVPGRRRFGERQAPGNRLEWRGLPPGEWTLECTPTMISDVQIFGESSPWEDVTRKVEVQANEVLELEPMTIEGLHRKTLEVRDEGERSIPLAVVISTEPNDRTSVGKHRIRYGRGPLYSTGAPPSLEVSALGYEPLSLVPNSPHVEVSLKPWPPAPIGTAARIDMAVPPDLGFDVFIPSRGNSSARDQLMTVENFALSERQSQALWPENDWLFIGGKAAADSSGQLTFEVVDARLTDRPILHCLAEFDTEAWFVLGYRGAEDSAEIGLFEIRADGMRTLAKGELPDWTTPSSSASSNHHHGDRWPGGRWSRHRIRDNEPRLLLTWSWNGLDSETLATIRHPNRDGMGSPPGYGFTGTLRVNESLRTTPLAEWPEPVWLLRVLYDIAD